MVSDMGTTTEGEMKWGAFTDEFFFYSTPFNPPAEARVKEDTFSKDTWKREGNVGRVKGFSVKLTFYENLQVSQATRYSAGGCFGIIF